MRFLLTDTKVSRDTKRLVAGVAEKKAQVRYPRSMQESGILTEFCLASKGAGAC
jgi:hypothetical protein